MLSDLGTDHVFRGLPKGQPSSFSLAVLHKIIIFRPPFSKYASNSSKIT